MSNELRTQMHYASVSHYYRQVLGVKDWEKRAHGRLNRNYENHMFNQLLYLVGDLDDKVLLDLGSGWGGVILNAAPCSRYSIGIEPDPERVRIAGMLLEKENAPNSNMIRGVGETIPVKDDSVDLVISYEVLEHVQNPEMVFKEVARVLKKEGAFHFTTPNYMSFREPHYKVFWLPLLPKIVGRLYLRLLGRNPDFINHINYVNPINIRRLLRRYSFTYIDLSYEKAVLKVKEILERMFPARGFLLRLQRMLMPLLRAATLVIYIGFLNTDQEFLAYKAR